MQMRKLLISEEKPPSEKLALFMLMYKDAENWDDNEEKWRKFRIKRNNLIISLFKFSSFILVVDVVLVVFIVDCLPPSTRNTE